MSKSKGYFSCVEILEKVVFSLCPRPFTTAMIATEMPAAVAVNAYFSSYVYE